MAFAGSRCHAGPLPLRGWRPGRSGTGSDSAGIENVGQPATQPVIRISRVRTLVDQIRIDPQTAARAGGFGSNSLRAGSAKPVACVEHRSAGAGNFRRGAVPRHQRFRQLTVSPKYPQAPQAPTGPHRRAGHGSARVCAPTAACTPTRRKTQPNATRPNTRGLPPTARPINARRSPMAAQHTHHPGEPGTEVPGCAPPKRRMHADTTQKRNRTQPGQAPVGSRPRLANQRPPLANGRSTHTPPGRAGHGSARVPPQTPHARRRDAKTRTNAPRQTPVGSRPRLANQHPPLANGRSTHTPHRRAGHGSARVRPPNAACTPTRRKNATNRTTPGTRGLPPTARQSTPATRQWPFNTHTTQASRARKCPGAVPNRRMHANTPQNATERNHARHPWAPAHGSPDQRRTLAPSGHTQAPTGEPGTEVPGCVPNRRMHAKTPQKRNRTPSMRSTRGLPPTARQVTARQSTARLVTLMRPNHMATLSLKTIFRRIRGEMVKG